MQKVFLVLFAVSSLFLLASALSFGGAQKFLHEDALQQLGLVSKNDDFFAMYVDSLSPKKDFHPDIVKFLAICWLFWAVVVANERLQKQERKPIAEKTSRRRMCSHRLSWTKPTLVLSYSCPCSLLSINVNTTSSHVPNSTTDCARCTAAFQQCVTT